MTKSELIDNAWASVPIHNCRVVDRAGVPFDVIDNGRLITRDDFTDILTRFLSEVRRDGVDVEKVWCELYTNKCCGENKIVVMNDRLDITLVELAAAIEAAGGGK